MKHIPKVLTELEAYWKCFLAVVQKIISIVKVKFLNLVSHFNNTSLFDLIS